MNSGQKMWANNNREAKSILNAAQASGFRLLDPESKYIDKGGFYLNGTVVTCSARDNREYFDNHQFKEFFFATPVELEDEDGWYEHSPQYNSECPVAFGTSVDVIFNGNDQPHEIYRSDAGDLDWTNDSPVYGQITGWRLSEKEVSVSDKFVEVPANAPVISDGLSTSYYQLTITNKAGESINCEMGDVIRAVVGNDADLFNIFKACRRAYESSQGRGKDGVTIEYDMNKVKYFADEFKHWNKSMPSSI